MPALSPSAADVSITAGNNSFSRTFIQEISNIDGVDEVFGRMEKTDLLVSSQKGSGTVTLISYDESQLKWAKDELNEGDVKSVQEGSDSVLVSYQDGMNWKVGDMLTLHTALNDKQVTVAGIMATINAENEAGNKGYIICSEQTFLELVGDLGYMTIDVQLSKVGNDDTVSIIRNMFPTDSSVLDKRLSNSEAQSSYYTGAIFIYGFLIIIALITVFNIFNSMNASVASRTKQYGIMRSIGMGNGQLYRMIAAEAFTYAVLGCLIGCLLGLPLNNLIYKFLIADKWGTSWKIPVASLLLIVLLCFGSAVIAIRRPIRQIRKMAIVDTIKLQS